LSRTRNITNRILKVVASSVLALSGNLVWAAPGFSEFEPVVLNATQALSPDEAFLRTLFILEQFGVPTEIDSQPLLEELQAVQTPEEIKRVLPFLDLQKTFQRYVLFDTSTGLMSAFQDPQSRKVPDFSVQLTDSPNSSFEPEFQKRLRAAAHNPKERPLAGLRIAIDPGHMGGNTWDQRTGKFIRSAKGQVLSEGILTLQTALLLESELVALGAEVLLSRRTLNAVSPLEFTKFDLRDFALEELRESSLQDWFQALLNKAPAGETLYRAFQSSREVKQIFSDFMRSKYFINRADLMARVNAIQPFSPDLTLIIHFDTLNSGPSNGVNPSGYNRTKAYVSGAFEKTEFASREDRRYFAQHLLDPVTWNASVQLSSAVVTQIGRQLGIRPDASGGSPSTRQVAPGVFSRNLHLNRKITGAPVSYLECLFYNDPTEFAALSNAKHPMRIDGVNHPYSDRLASLANALRDAVLEFVRQSGDPR